MDGAQLVVAVPGEGDLAVRVPGHQLRVQAPDLLLGQVIRSDLPDAADAVQRLTGAPAMAQRVLLHLRDGPRPASARRA